MLEVSVRPGPGCRASGGAPGGETASNKKHTLTLGTVASKNTEPGLRSPELGQGEKAGQLLAVDHSARASMKNAASCEN